MPPKFLWNTDPQKLVEQIRGNDLYIVAAQNGLYDIRVNEIGTFIARVQRPIMHLQPVFEGVVLSLPRVPFDVLKQAVHFLKNYALEHVAEARYQIFWNREQKKYYGHVPQFKSTISSIETVRSYELEQKDLLVVDLHSHLTATAIFSEVDDKNEMESGRFYGVVAVLNHWPDIDVRFSCGGNYVHVSPWVIFENPFEKGVFE